jgi:hypothetical protein
MDLWKSNRQYRTTRNRLTSDSLADRIMNFEDADLIDEDDEDPVADGSSVSI